MEEKRKNKRSDLKVTAELTVISVGGGNRVVEADVTDLSPTGIGFVCPDELEIGAVCQTKIKIWTEETIPAIVKIVRCIAKEGQNIYGGIFVGMENSDILRIQVYQMFSKEVDIETLE